ncbi:MAG: ABC transporter permease [Hespellia sp.]|nr:ABC transporter permease [Hespellia sp.]
MKKRALRKDFYMEIKKSPGRFMSIFFIVAIGVAFFSGIRSAEPDMKETGDAYYDEQNLMDIKVISTLGLTDEDVSALKKVDGVKDVNTGYMTDVLCDNNDSKNVLHVESILSDLNKITVTEGRLPKTSKECLVDANYLEKSDYKVGDTVTFSSGNADPVTDTLATDTYTIVGAGTSPAYLSIYRGSSTIGDGNVDGFVYLARSGFSQEAYSQICLTVDGAKELTAYSKEYDSRVNEVLDYVKAIKKERQEARYHEIVDEATEKLDDAKAELADAKSEAEEKLSDAKAQIDDGNSQLNAAKDELASARQKIADSRAELIAQQNTIDQNQAEIDRNFAELQTKTDELNASIEQLNALKEQYNALAASGQTDEQTMQTLQMMAAQIQAGDAAIADGKTQIEAGQAQLADAQNQLNDGQIQINNGWEQIHSGEAELADGEAEITENEQKLLDAQTEYDDAKAEADEKIADGEKKIADAEEEVRKIEHAKWYVYDRSNITEYDGFGENADRMKAIGEVFPVLFFLVAALISLTSMTRMVEEQRTQIGTLKALGYSRINISSKYLGYAFLATVGGSILGVIVGEKTLPYIIVNAYGIMYPHIDDIKVPFQMQYAYMAGIAAFICTMGATIFSCYKELAMQAAELMRPPTPKNGKRVFMERITIIWKHLSFIWKATVRNLMRYKKRFFMTIFGIGGSMALMLVGFGIKDSISNIAVLQYDSLQLYDGMIIMEEDASESELDHVKDTLKSDSRVSGAMELVMENVSASSEKKTMDVYLNVPKNLKDLSQYLVFRDRVSGEEYKLDEDGVILTEKTAKLLDVQVGDTVQIKDDTLGDIEVKISAICENYLQHYMYMSPELYQKLYQKTPQYNAAYFELKEFDQKAMEMIGENALNCDGALSASYTNDVQDQLDQMLGSLDFIIVVLIISAGMLAFVVLYNLNNINISERQRELATLKVLGFYDKEVSSYVFRENVILTLIGVIVGSVLGMILHRFIIVTVEIDTCMFGRTINAVSYAYSALITIAFSLFVNWVMYFKLKKINMVESLKSVE